jgi:hypothetical protein
MSVNQVVKIVVKPLRIRDLKGEKTLKIMKNLLDFYRN